MRAKPSTTLRTRARLLQRLSSRSSYDRARAAFEIGTLNDRTFLQPLEERAMDPSFEVRAAVAEALGLIPGPPSTKLLDALTDSDELVRTNAVESVSAKHYVAALPILKRMLLDPSSLVRSYAAAAIGAVGGKSERRRLQQRLARESSDAVILGIAEGLWLLGDKTVLRAALKLLNSADYRTRCATAQALSSTFLTRQSANRIQQELEERLKAESTTAPRQAITTALRTVVKQRRGWLNERTRGFDSD
jgi:HEAT repeat protein